MEKEKLDKLLEAIEGIGFCLVSFSASRGGATLQIKKELFVNERGEFVDPETGELIDPVTGRPLPRAG